MDRLFYLTFLISLVLLVSNSLAISFTASITPSTINATTTTYLNLNISNSDTSSITQVNVTLPSVFSYKGSSSPPVSSVSENLLIWNYVIGSGSSQNFNFSVSSSNVGVYNFYISLSNGTGFDTTNIPVTVNDINPPSYSSISTSPQSPANYTPNGNYTFSITWDDNVRIDSVFFSLDSGTNQTVSSSGSTYSITKTALSAGNHTYQWYASDTGGNWNTTGKLNYTISLASNPINMSFNGNLNSNTSINNGSQLNVSVNGIGNLILYQDSLQVASNISCSSNCSLSYTPSPNLQLGIHNFTVTAAGDQNYLPNSSTFFVNVIYPPPQWSSETTPSSQTYSSGGTYTFSIVWSILSSSPLNLSNVTFRFNTTSYLVNGTGNSTYASYSVTLQDLSASTYTYQWIAKDTNNMTNSTTLSTFTLAKATPSLSISGTGTYQYSGTSFNISGTNCPTSGAKDVTCKLHFNGSSVSNPYSFTPKVGSHTFVFNTSGGMNWTSFSTSGVLEIVSGTTNQTNQNNTQQNLTTSTFNTSGSSNIVQQVRVVSTSPLVNAQVNVARPTSLPALNITNMTTIDYLEITYTGISSSQVSRIDISFRVPEQTIQEMKIDSSTVVLYRYFNGQWNSLDTTKVSSDSNYHYYSATTSGLSIYAIAGRIKVAQPPSSQQPPTSGITTKSYTWILIVIAIVVFIAVSGGVYFFLFRKGGEDRYKELKKKWGE